MSRARARFIELLRRGILEFDAAEPELDGRAMLEARSPDGPWARRVLLQSDPPAWVA